MSPPVQELPDSYKLVRFLCLPLTRNGTPGGRALRAVFVAAEKGKKIARADCADEAGRPVGCGLVPVSL